MSVRLVWVAHAPTAGMRALVFGDESSLLHPELVPPWTERFVGCTRGPEPACAETAAALGVVAGVESRLANVNPGSWRGSTFVEVQDREPGQLAAWLSDPDACPHGGERLADVVARVGAYCDEGEWADGAHLLVASPLVVRAAVVHALGVPVAAIFRIDVAPLLRVTMSRSTDTWRLRL